MAELNLRTAMQNAIKRCHDKITDHSFHADAVQLDQELMKLDGYFNKFVANHDILVLKAKPDDLAVHETLGFQVEEIYYEARLHLQRARQQFQSATDKAESTNLGNESQHGFELKLDPLAVPSFDGALHNWLAFKDTFEALVHNQSYPEAYKLGKLRQAVRAEQVPLVGGMYSGGYEEVWRALKVRYDNPKQLAEIHVSRFINLPSATNETSSVLLNIVDTVRESFRALRVMPLPVESWDAIAVPIMVSKLPYTAQQAWGMSSTSNAIPKLEDLLCFLERRAHSLNSDQVGWSVQAKQGRPVQRDSSRTNTSTPRFFKSNLVTSVDNKCSICSGPHRLTHCQRFLGFTIEQRFNVLKGTNLCFNCFRAGHSSKQCPGGDCRKCGQRHNTLLCRTQLSATAAQQTSLNSRQINSTEMQTAHGPTSS